MKTKIICILAVLLLMLISPLAIAQDIKLTEEKENIPINSYVDANIFVYGKIQGTQYIEWNEKEYLEVTTKIVLCIALTGIPQCSFICLLRRGDTFYFDESTFQGTIESDFIHGWFEAKVPGPI